MNNSKILSDFVKSREVENILLAGFNSGENVVLYGPPGYGKSEMSETFLRRVLPKEKHNEIFIKSLSIGTGVDDLFGGVDLKELKETGRIIFNLEDSMFNKEYVILEEAFDAPPVVLMSLKDTLTSGYVRNGNQIFKIRTKFIIICTNKSKSEIGVDHSSKALMERFPLSLRVEWSSHKFDDYWELGMSKGIDIEDNLELLAFIQPLLKLNEKANHHISPRAFVKMLKIYSSSGLPHLKYMEELNADVLFESSKEFFEVLQTPEVQKVLKEYRKTVGLYSSLPYTQWLDTFRKFLAKHIDTIDRAQLVPLLLFSGRIKNYMDLKSKIRILEEVMGDKEKVSEIVAKATVN